MGLTVTLSKTSGIQAVMQHVLKFYFPFCIFEKTNKYTHTSTFRNKQWQLQTEGVPFVKCGVILKTESILTELHPAKPQQMFECQHLTRGTIFTVWRSPRFIHVKGERQHASLVKCWRISLIHYNYLTNYVATKVCGVFFSNCAALMAFCRCD